ncbi:hypothetical protein AWB81_07044 [Caballeronia arationis]|nr:hypothetical protein AWB81_07044 [Caballeronia arationis]
MLYNRRLVAQNGLHGAGKRREYQQHRGDTPITVARCTCSSLVQRDLSTRCLLLVSLDPSSRYSATSDRYRSNAAMYFWLSSCRKIQEAKIRLSHGMRWVAVDGRRVGQGDDVPRSCRLIARAAHSPIRGIRRRSSSARGVRVVRSGSACVMSMTAEASGAAASRNVFCIHRMSARLRAAYSAGSGFEIDPEKRTPILLKRRCRNGQASYAVPGGIPGANG